VPGLGSIVLGALAVFVLVVGSLLFQSVRRSRARQARRNNLGLVRISAPDPARIARILSGFPAPANDTRYALGGLERVGTDLPGTWYVAMVRQTSAVGDDTRAPTHVLLVIDGLRNGDTPSEPTIIEGTDRLWTRRHCSGLLLVEGVAGAGDAVRDLDRMKAAGARAVAAPAALL